MLTQFACYLRIESRNGRLQDATHCSEATQMFAMLQAKVREGCQITNKLGQGAEYTATN